MALRHMVPPAASTIRTINPANGQVVRTFDPHTDADIDLAIERATAAFAQWRLTSFDQRRRLLLAAADILDDDRQNFARLMTLEMGKLLRAGGEEAHKCARACRYYAENGARFLADEPHPTSAASSFVRYQPLGVILAVMPWNFPFWQVFRCAAPAIMAGNVVLLKHASNVPQCALAIEEIFDRAGFPDAIFQTLLIPSGKVNRILEDPRVAAASLTGSVGAGSSVASAAGKYIKKTVLELGGSDPFLVMPSADLDAAADTAVTARTINTGQSCVAAKRFIVHEHIADEFLSRFVDRMKSLKVGDPNDESTEIGPLATEQGLRDVAEQVNKTVQMGAHVLCGGHVIDRPGWFYAPTVLTDIPKDSPAYKDEIFGPVASVFRVRNVDEGLRIANDTRFGLGSSLWSNDEFERRKFIDEIQAGMAFINSMVASDPPIPFGGIKQSGYGRELSEHGIREFVNVKTVFISEPERAGKETE